MKHPWFKAKAGGLAWCPATWQGWLVLAAFVACAICNFVLLDVHSHSASDTLRPFVIQSLGLGLILFLIGYLTGEKLHWRGLRRDNGRKENPV